MNKTLWIVMKKIKSEYGNLSIEGVFDQEQKAIDRCYNNNYIIAPINLNEIYPEGILQWPGAYYPNPEDIVEGTK